MKKREREEDLLQLEPAAEYVVPKYPTHADISGNAKLLQNLPSRWQKNVKVMACLGITGMAVLSGCVNLNSDTNYGAGYTENNNWSSEYGLSIMIHHGGFSGAPIYIAYLTESEVLGIIRTQLEAVGLNFNDNPPEYVVEMLWSTIGLDLFDKERGVALTLISAEDSHQHFSLWGYELAEQVADDFSQQTNDISIGVFHNSGEIVSSDEPNAEEKSEAELILRENLDAQIHDFIVSLQAEGILN